ncbi:phosphoacetylglucosamine mutase [Ordospora colligata]|uniref:phosphoacetylglucosamine mutase n=1 Tax=Ordospora colligata OC4 TaxID=1354746 RepID=A0A0B2UMW2_9MICR|nr:phosphoacetylglucosamine mutase [Ordospora colligata OC4]KHN70402.1 phosphoacetylglucosamine mutase [Ordospora colligata OC4]TBU17152.1 phosphoacetylglucosamine mutase [Ordospora colligata]TBU19582.1 phosphoacetylglucosamine mutase [Ordospora colligata]
MDKILLSDDNLRKPSKPAYYGTAGYRSKDSDQNNIMCRASLIAYLRSTTLAGKVIGVMITASHNPVEHNGIKIIDHTGNMLDEKWEQHSDVLVNCEDKDLPRVMRKILMSFSNQTELGEGVRGHVVLGRDTRESGVSICKNIASVLGKLNCTVDDYGVVTTPELHFLVRRSNLEDKIVEKEEYTASLVNNFRKLVSNTGLNFKMAVDTANGVAGIELDELKKSLGGDLRCRVLNDANGILNLDCGADFVKTKNRAPKLEVLESAGFSVSTDEICASFDGDADRLMFFTGPTRTRIFDGDFQAVFLAFFIKQHLDAIDSKMSMGVVLSHYSNDAAIGLLRSNSFDVVLAQTGVKNFVNAARAFDVGVYFEPNGHGSVYFSQAFFDEIAEGTSKHHEILKAVSGLFDPCVGDAVANFLVFKGIMASANDLSKFKENPSRLHTVVIKDKNSIKVNLNNRVLEPKGLQEMIDAEMANFKGRSFVRPSGTENVVRIYAECSDSDNTDLLCLNVATHVYTMCEGVGNLPEIDYTK